MLGQAGVKWVIVLEGVNDIGNASSAAVGDELIGAYQEFIEKAHAANVRVYGVTILPFGGSLYDSETREQTRQYVNAWIRESDEFDAVLDLEPVVADGGELIIYAPHVKEISVTHGRLIEEVGYHCRDYFLGQWDRFKHIPWGVLAHSTHVRGIGTYKDGQEQCRIRVTLATGIPEATCRRINLGYRDPASIRVEDFANREAEGILHVPKAGEMLYRLDNPPAWSASA